MIFSSSLLFQTGAHLTKKEVEAERKEVYVHFTSPEKLCSLQLAYFLNLFFVVFTIISIS